MKRILFLIFSFGLTLAAGAQEGPEFVYNEHSRRDPFLPLVSLTGAVISYDDSEGSGGDMSLEGIVVDAKGQNLAILNGKIVKAGDKVGEATVKEIFNDHVDLLKGEETLSVKLKKGAS